MSTVSTTALARSWSVEPKGLFERLSQLGLIERSENRWVLTAKGKEAGGKMQEGANAGQYIVWPEGLNLSYFEKNLKDELLSATDIAKHFNSSPQKVNKNLSSLGWIELQPKGWLVTNLGKGQGGVEFKASTGKRYVKWPKDILDNDAIQSWFQSMLSESEKRSSSEPIVESEAEDVGMSDRQKLDSTFEPKHICLDGHKVRSKDETIIDNWLFSQGLVHAYDWEIRGKQGKMFCDFYIPPGARKRSHGVYIEYWGVQNNKAYEARKRKKLQLYKKLDILDELIQLEPKHLKDLSSYLGAMLLEVAEIELK